MSGLDSSELIDSILRSLRDNEIEGKTITNLIIEELGGVTTSAVDVNEETGKVTIRSNQNAFIFDDAFRTMTYEGTKYTGLEIIVDLIVRKVVQKLVETISEEVVQHIKDNLEVTIPPNSFIVSVVGQATGTPNLTPIILRGDNIN